MQLDALAIILVGSAAVGLLLYAPFFFWFRWRRRNGRLAAPGKYGKSLPRGEFGWAVLIVSTLFIGLAQGHLAPSTWFGSQMQTVFGQAVFLITLVVIIVVIRVAWLLFKVLVLKIPIQSAHATKSDA